MPGATERPQSGEVTTVLGAEDVRLGPLLFATFGGVLAWTLHLLVCYFVVALDCATGWNGSDAAVVIATVVLAAAAAASGVVGHRLWRRRQPRAGWLAALGEARDQVGLLVLVGIVLDLISLLAIAFAGVAPFFVPTCS